MVGTVAFTLKYIFQIHSIEVTQFNFTNLLKFCSIYYHLITAFCCPVDRRCKYYFHYKYMDFYSEENKRGGTNIDETLYNEITLFVPFSIFNINSAVSTMVHILDGNSEIVAHVKSNLCSLICLRHLIR